MDAQHFMSSDDSNYNFLHAPTTPANLFKIEIFLAGYIHGRMTPMAPFDAVATGLFTRIAVLCQESITNFDFGTSCVVYLTLSATEIHLLWLDARVSLH
jgi:hypothetical protein